MRHHLGLFFLFITERSKFASFEKIGPIAQLHLRKYTRSVANSRDDPLTFKEASNQFLRTRIVRQSDQWPVATRIENGVEFRCRRLNLRDRYRVLKPFLSFSILEKLEDVHEVRTVTLPFHASLTFAHSGSLPNASTLLWSKGGFPRNPRAFPSAYQRYT